MRAIILAALILLAGCAGEKIAKEGDAVSVNYIGSLQGGKVFDTSYENIAREKGIYQSEREYEPLAFTVGAGQMITGFDEAVVGMREGEEKEVMMPPEKAYGFVDTNLIGAVPRKIFEQSGIAPETGRAIAINGRNARIVSFNETEVTVDLNHELAGKTLVFKVRLEKIG